MRISKLLCILLGLGWSLLAFAQEISSELEDDSGAYAECAAYFELAYHAVNSAGETESAATYFAAQQTANLYALLLAMQGRDEELAAEVTNARIEMYLEQMRRETNNRAENISILINNYHFECSDIIEMPKESVLRLLSESPSRAE